MTKNTKLAGLISGFLTACTLFLLKLNPAYFSNLPTILAIASLIATFIILALTTMLPQAISNPDQAPHVNLSTQTAEQLWMELLPHINKLMFPALGREDCLSTDTVRTQVKAKTARRRIETN